MRDDLFLIGQQAWAWFGHVHPRQAADPTVRVRDERTFEDNNLRVIRILQVTPIPCRAFPQYKS